MIANKPTQSDGVGQLIDTLPTGRTAGRSRLLRWLLTIGLTALVLALLRVVRVALFAFVPMQARVAPALRVRVVRAAIVRVLALPLALPVRAPLRAVRVDRVRLRRLIPMN